MMLARLGLPTRPFRSLALTPGAREPGEHPERKPLTLDLLKEDPIKVAFSRPGNYEKNARENAPGRISRRQDRDRKPESVGEPVQRIQRHIGLGALNMPDERAVHSGESRQRLLAEMLLAPKASDVPGKDSARFARALRRPPDGDKMPLTRQHIASLSN